MNGTSFSSKGCKDISAISQDQNLQLLIRTGLAQQISSGIFSYLPLGTKVLNKIQKLIKAKMNCIGALEVVLPILQPYSFWEKTGRIKRYGAELFCLEDRLGTKFVVCPTSEELVTLLVKQQSLNSNQLPIYLYQLQPKFRDELRPRSGAIRSREFVMKDCYSFDADLEASNCSYNLLSRTYKKIFKELKLKFRRVFADPGPMGGIKSHEFLAFAERGETKLIYCTTSDRSTQETSGSAAKTIQTSVSGRNIWAPDVELGRKTFQYLAINSQNIILSKDRTIANSIIRTETSDWTVLNINFGSTEENLRGRMMFWVKLKTNGSSGVALLSEKNQPILKEPALKTSRTVEVGHIFQLGAVYSTRLKAFYSDANNNRVPYAMGCYGIGITRVLGVLAEQKHSKILNKIFWPIVISPVPLVIILSDHCGNAQKRSVSLKVKSLVQKVGGVVVEGGQKKLTLAQNDWNVVGTEHFIIVDDSTIQYKTLRYQNSELMDEKVVLVGAARRFGEKLTRPDTLLQTEEHKSKNTNRDQ